MNNVAYPATTFDITPILSVSTLVLFAIVGALVYVLIGKLEQIKELKQAYQKIMESFNELDEQAKLIVKTDLELHKAQEELDRRLTGLNTLQKLSRKMSMTLDENEIFRKIDPSLIADLGFSRSIVLTYNEDGEILCRVDIGFEKEQLERIREGIQKTSEIFNALRDGLTFSSLSSSQKTRSFISPLFDAEHFVLSPLLTQRGVAGILFVGNRNNAPEVTEGDEELVSILANQLAQAIENAQLFEQVYRSSQMLETKVNERTRELTLALKEVEEISQKKSEFISAVSHELRTPLTSIKGYASILMTGKVGDIPEAVKDRLGKINLHSDNLVKLINDLLDISRIEAGRVEMKTAVQPVKPLLDNVADLLTPQLKDKDVTLRIHVPADMPELDLDASQIERVFINLIGNAIKFTPPKGMITINAIGQPEKKLAFFEVADTGIGIKREDLPKLFDEFYREDNQINMNVKGTGLGLALVKNIVEAHGGRIWVTSEVNAGTTFHFTLPFHRGETRGRKRGDGAIFR